MNQNFGIVIWRQQKRKRNRPVGQIADIFGLNNGCAHSSDNNGNIIHF